MGLASWLFGAGGDAIAKPVEAVGNALDQLVTSDEERAAAALMLEKLRQAPDILQAEITKQEAAHPSVFVAGPRPFILWICGAAFGLHFVAFPLLNFGIALLGYPQIGVAFDMDTLMTALFGILGLGGLRTMEKRWGVAR